MDDEDGRQDGEPQHGDPPPDRKNNEDSSKSGLEIFNTDLEKTTEVKALKPWNCLFENKPTGKSSFPSVEDISDRKIGKFAIAIPDVVIHHSISLMAFSLAGKFVGPRPNIEDVRSSVKKKWRLKGQVDVLALSRGFFVFSFSCGEDLEMILSGGPWMFGKSLLSLRKWSPNIELNDSFFESALVWVRLPSLPLEF
ncbi:uncharacterized protein LOC131063516 [Cryptomeria japonica]|uniref:uncharacterized protein LOC131063516 n=1 Tax=Cryptomeria japonica TaxID=3369 RepID=UPI0025AC3D8F|nr:uncharacterized protein LOC131063516 [Cryptomeria japonica]